MDQDWIYTEIGDIVRRRRKKLGKTQAELAPKLGLSRASVANIETGRQSLLVHQLYALAEALELSPQDLLPASSSAPSSGVLKFSGDVSDRQKDQLSRLIADAVPEPEDDDS
jgi:transcriptional regulator with XRE-family HTH domain